MGDAEILQNLRTITTPKDQLQELKANSNCYENQLNAARQESEECKAKIGLLENEKTRSQNEIRRLENEVQTYQTSIISQEESKQSELSALYDKLSNSQEKLEKKEK